jgi:hypothetical protein
MTTFKKPIAICFLSILLPITGCHNPTAPSAPAAAVPQYPAARANATVLENLALMRALAERETGLHAVVSSIGGHAVRDGRVSPGSGWGYTFAVPTGSDFRFLTWGVNPAGLVGYEGEDFEGIRRFSVVDFTPTVDSDRAVTLALQYGGQAYLDRHPASYWQFVGRVFLGVPIWEISLVDPNLGGACHFGPITIHAQTGELVARDLSCPL